MRDLTPPQQEIFYPIRDQGDASGASTPCVEIDQKYGLPTASPTEKPDSQPLVVGLRQGMKS